MNGIRLFDQPLRLKERSSSSGNAGGSVEAVPPQPLMRPPSFTTVPQANSSNKHAGLLRSSSEPDRLGSNWHESQRRRFGSRPDARKRAVGPYPRPLLHQRASQGFIAQNIASRLLMLNQANGARQQIHQFDARNNSYWHQNYHQQFNAYGSYWQHWA